MRVLTCSTALAAGMSPVAVGTRSDDGGFPASTAGTPAGVRSYTMHVNKAEFTQDAFATSVNTCLAKQPAFTKCETNMTIGIAEAEDDVLKTDTNATFDTAVSWYFDGACNASYATVMSTVLATQATGDIFTACLSEEGVQVAGIALETTGEKAGLSTTTIALIIAGAIVTLVVLICAICLLVQSCRGYDEDALHLTHYEVSSSSDVDVTMGEEWMHQQSFQPKVFNKASPTDNESVLSTASGDGSGGANDCWADRTCTDQSGSEDCVSDCSSETDARLTGDVGLVADRSTVLSHGSL